jgi:hypothetical protein
LEVLENSVAYENFTLFQKEVRKSLDTLAIHKTCIGQKLVIPRIVFRDGAIAAILPQNSESQWTIRADGDLLCSETCDSFVPFDADLPHSITISKSGTDRDWEFALWEDNKNNRMLLFNGRDGRFITRVNFGDDDIAVRPGPYILLSRFSPSVPDLDTSLVQDYPEVYATQINLAPGVSLQISRGPASLTLRADSVPLLEIIGNGRTDLEGQEILASEGLKLKVCVSEEFNDQDLSVRIQSKCLGNPIDFKILSQNSRAQQTINLTDLLHDWEPGVSRITVSCRRSNSQRILTRASTVLWNGLKSLERQEGFICSFLPLNFNMEESVNVAIKKQSQTDENGFFIKEPLYKTWTTVFVDNGHRLIFIWGRPGLNMRLRTFGDGQSIERTLLPGSMISIKSNIHEVLMISGLGQGTLRLGEQSWGIDSKQKFWKAPVLSLVDSVTDHDALLTFESSMGVHKNLLQFVTPHHVENFYSVFTSEQISISFDILSPPDSFMITATDIFTGKSNRCFVESHAPWSSMEPFTCGGELCSEVDGSHCSFKISCEGWPSGLWMLQIEATCQKRLGRITNIRLDQFALILPIQDGHLVSNQAYDIINFAEEYDIDLSTLLLKIHPILLCCHAPETWEKIKWIKSLWKILIAKFEDSLEAIAIFMAMLDEPLPKEAHPGWIPLLHLALETPKLFAWPAKQYSGFIPEHNHLVYCLGNLNLLLDPLQALSDGDISTGLGMGFEDFVSLRRFNLKKALSAVVQLDVISERKVLRDPEWIPGLGHYLGPLHLRYVLHKFWDNWEKCSLGEGNQHRRSCATMIARKAVNARFLPTSEILADRATWDKFLLYGQDNIQSDAREIFLGSTIFLATYAYLCRRMAHRGSIDASTAINEYLEKLNPETENPEYIAIGAEYLLAIGENLFGFYLMFWEFLFETGL